MHFVSGLIIHTRTGCSDTLAPPGQPKPPCRSIQILYRSIGNSFKVINPKFHTGLSFRLVGGAVLVQVGITEEPFSRFFNFAHMPLRVALDVFFNTGLCMYTYK